MTLKEQIAADVAGVFLDLDGFAETLTYFPPGGGAPRAIVAIVERNVVDDERGRAHVTELAVCVVHAAEDAVSGLSGLERGAAVRLESDLVETDRWDFRRVVQRAGGMVSAEFGQRRHVETGRISPADL